MPPTRVHLSSTDGHLEMTASTPYGTLPTGARLERDRRVRKEQRSREEYARERTEDARIYVGNLSYTVQRNDVAKLFDEAGYDVVNIDISIDPVTVRNPSYCFVDLVSAEAASSAMHNLNGENFFRRPLKIKPCVQKRDNSQGGQAEGVIFDRWNNGPGRGDTAQPSQSRDYLLRPVLEKRRLYVGGLPKPLDTLTSDVEIREMFREFRVEAVSKVKSPRENHRPGNHFYAFVDLDSPEEAEEAARHLNGTVAFGGRLKVNLATSGSGRDLFESARREESSRTWGRERESSSDLPY